MFHYIADHDHSWSDYLYQFSGADLFYAGENWTEWTKFKMYKFRSMYMDAEERKKELMDQNKISDGLMFKMDFDLESLGIRCCQMEHVRQGLGSLSGRRAG